MINKDSTYNRYLTIIIVLSLISGLALTVLGFSKLPWPQSIPWVEKNALVRFLGVLVFITLTISLLAKKLYRNSGLAVAMTAALLAVVAGTILPLLITLLLAGASSVLGYWLLKRLKIDCEVWVNCFLVGVGVYGTVIGLLAHYPVNYPGVYGTALLLPLVLGWRVVLEKGKSLFAHITKPNLAQMALNWVELAIAALALVYFVVALMPELGFDSLAMHLYIPAHMGMRHQWGFDAGTYVWAVMPMLGDWIFSMGYMLAGETAARLINVGFIFILGWLIRDMVLWAGGSLVGAGLAVLIFLSTPLTFTEGSSLYIESIWACFVVAGVLAILRACASTGKPRLELPIAALLLGFALATKAVTFTVLPALLLLLTWRYKSWYKPAGLQVIIFGLGLFLVIGSIPYVTAWCLTGNPVFPLFNKIFKSTYYLSAENFANPIYGTGLTWDVLYRITFESGKYLEASIGASGFQWLLLFIPTTIVLIACRHRRGVALLLVGVLAIVFVFSSQTYLRYVFPSWAILSATIGLALSTIFSSRILLKNSLYTITGICVVLNLVFFHSGNGFYRDFPVQVIFDKTNRDKYLLSRMPIRNAVELVNHHNSERSPIAVFADPLSAGLSGDALYPSWYNIKFQKEIATIKVEQDFIDILLKRGVNFIILDSAWNGVNCCGEGVEKQAIIERATEKVAEYGSISVRKIKANYQFKTELLKNSDLKSIIGWNLPPEAKYDAIAGVILASAAFPAFQQVGVSPGGRYLNSISSRCAKEPTLGRIQVNWLDVKGRVDRTDIKTFECTSAWSDYAMEVTAPQNAVNAIVYISGQTAIPLEFKRNSLRQ